MQLTPPSVAQLAVLAATLARDSEIEPDKLADAALALWKACRARLERDWRELRDKDDEGDYLESLPWPKKFPITHKELVTTRLPRLKGKTVEVARIFRAYCRHLLKERLKREPSEEETTQLFEEKFNAQITSREYKAEMAAFDMWYWHYHAEDKSQKRRAAALASWKERTKRKTGARPNRVALKEVRRAWKLAS